MESIDENKQLENSVVGKVETEATNTQNVKPEKREIKTIKKQSYLQSWEKSSVLSSCNAGWNFSIFVWKMEFVL